MSEVLIKKNNTAVLEALIKDSDGVTLTTLAQATEVLFKVIDCTSEKVVKISKSLIDGISINTPSTGYIRITLKPTDTDLPAETYLMGLQIKWDAETIYEVDLSFSGKQTVFFRISEDVVE